MAVTAHDQRDYEFAIEHELPIHKVLVENNEDADMEIKKAFEGYGKMVNSSREGFDGLSGDDAKRALIDTFQNRIHLIFIHISFIFIKIKQNKP